MIVRKLTAWVGGLAVAFCIFPLSPVLGEEDTPQADVVGEASSPSPKVPVRVKVVDYQKAEEGPGTLKLSGTAIAGSDVSIFIDDRPLAQVSAGEGDGQWEAEEKIALGDRVYTIRVEQYDKGSNTLSGRAMFNISLSPPTPEQLAAPPPR